MLDKSKEDWFSGDFVGGVLNNWVLVHKALDQLAFKGIPKEDIVIFHGEKGEKELGDLGGKGLVGLILRAMEDYVGNAKEITDRHKAEAALGHYVVLIKLPSLEFKDDVQQVLKSNDGHDIMDRSNGTYSTLEWD
jgi:hypothetical protein